MSKEFIEYHSEDGRGPYSAAMICSSLEQYAKNYVKENDRITSNIDKNVRDAVLVDAINYIGLQGWIDYALYTNDLYSQKSEKISVSPQCLLTVAANHCAFYMFNENMVDSVLRNDYMNECNKEFDPNDGAIVLLDFVNYIAQRNDYDKRFTMRELYERFKTQKHNCEMKKLKEFLELTDKYSELLANGYSIDNVFENMLSKHNLKYVPEDGTYHYIDEINPRLVKDDEIHPWTAIMVNKEVDAMAYAYAKMNDGSKQVPQAKIINERIVDMKRR